MFAILIFARPKPFSINSMWGVLYHFYTFAAFVFSHMKTCYLEVMLIKYQQLSNLKKVHVLEKYVCVLRTADTYFSKFGVVWSCTPQDYTIFSPERERWGLEEICLASSDKLKQYPCTFLKFTRNEKLVNNKCFCRHWSLTVVLTIMMSIIMADDQTI